MSTLIYTKGSRRGERERGGVQTHIPLDSHGSHPTHIGTCAVIRVTFAPLAANAIGVNEPTAVEVAPETTRMYLLVGSALKVTNEPP